MNQTSGDFDYGEVKSGTGSLATQEEFKIIRYPLGKYIISVKVNLSNEFIEITEVEIKKEFLSYKQKMTIKGFHDVDEFYPE